MITIAFAAIIVGLLFLSLIPAENRGNRDVQIVAGVDRVEGVRPGPLSAEQQLVNEDVMAVERDKAAVAAEQECIEAMKAEQSPRSATAISSDSILRNIVLLASIALLMGFVYLFLDAARRARYTWVIRAGSVAAFAVTCIVLWKITPQL
jgi:hypothetical protein